MNKLFEKLKTEQYKVPFFAAIIFGLITHAVVIVNKLPNGDSMTNFYFDQNMVTSGRWFLTVVCGISSYYDLNLVNGLLAVFFLAISTVFVTRFFEMKNKSSMILTAAVMMTFPAVAATMSYMYTVDGYMIGLLLAIVAAYVTRKYKWGFVGGAFALAFSLGTYQAYVGVTVLLCIFDLMLGIVENEEIKKLWNRGWKYLVMGISGGALYYGILKLCLFFEKKELSDYQGLNEMGQIAVSDIPSKLYSIYYDFASFSLRGHIFVNNIFSLIAMILIIAGCILSVCVIIVSSKAYKKWYNWLLLVVLTSLIPIGANMMLFLSNKPAYHLLMRMQWEMFIVIAVVLMERANFKLVELKENVTFTRITAVILISVLCYNFFITDNIAYFNLNEMYEKTYGYCLRLLDRIEQTEGYYAGMPICMVGVVSEESYPSTDITFDITSGIRGTSGDFLLYRGEQYREFMKNYLGATLNILEGDAVNDMYYSEQYMDMSSFPDKDSIRIVDGIMYIKLE